MKYEVQIFEDVPFEPKPGEYKCEVLNRSGTVVIISINDKGEPTQERYGLVDRKEVYSLIEAGQIINLNFCYIAGFSLDEYRKKRSMNKGTNVLIKLYQARNTFFDTGKSFENAIGYKLYSSKSMSGYNDVSFNRAHFVDGDVDFGGAKFGNAKVDFYRVNFGNGRVNFKGTQFGDGKVVFKEAKFADGTVK